ncbi:hypothetical protein TNCT_562631 [Trichonephila clavata]|uniref:Uncharacterized protein n=1 Tax=Trichonephila clavata TaxID=2740835 RepID=A0A8X6KMZ8_TRICU|nr:hypothetical protein TNCT_562631 [Trichonephila clavata]
MASCSKDWPYLAQEISEETTIEQPKPSTNQQSLRKIKLEGNEKNNESWCQSVFCARKKGKKITTEMQESLRSSEMQNSECMKGILKNGCFPDFMNALWKKKEGIHKKGINLF